MDLENIRGTKRNTVWHCLYVKSKKMIQRNLFAKQKETLRHRHRE